MYIHRNFKMNLKLNQKVLLLVLLTGVLQFTHLSPAMAQSRDSGGGDTICESRFKDIRKDLAKWLKQGGPEKRQLDLSEVPGLNYPIFRSRVEPWLEEGVLVISCVNPDKDKGPLAEFLMQKLRFYGSKKICVFEPYNKLKEEETKLLATKDESFDDNALPGTGTKARKMVICDSREMRPLGRDTAERILAGAQYQQVVHEILGAAGIEAPANDGVPEDSPYPISPQFSSFLESVTIDVLSLSEPADDVTSKFRFFDVEMTKDNIRSRLKEVSFETSVSNCDWNQYEYGGEVLPRHLPTARELAEYAMEQGAYGILEVAQYQELAITRNLPDFIEIKALNRDGTSDHFYYSNTGYHQPPGRIGVEGTWSSSLDMLHARPEFRPAYFFNGWNGKLDYLNSDLSETYACVLGKKPVVKLPGDESFYDSLPTTVFGRWLGNKIFEKVHKP